jgi:hypothetical protein
MSAAMTAATTRDETLNVDFSAHMPTMAQYPGVTFSAKTGGPLAPIS